MILTFALSNSRCAPGSTAIPAENSRYVQRKHVCFVSRRQWVDWTEAPPRCCLRECLGHTEQDSKRTYNVAFRRVRIFAFWTHHRFNPPLVTVFVVHNSEYITKCYFCYSGVIIFILRTYYLYVYVDSGGLYYGNEPLQSMKCG